MLICLIGTTCGQYRVFYQSKADVISGEIGFLALPSGRSVAAAKIICT